MSEPKGPHESEEVNAIGDGSPDLSRISLADLAKLDDSVLARALARLRDDDADSAIAGFQSRI